MHKVTKAGTPEPDPANTLYDAVMLLSAFGFCGFRQQSSVIDASVTRASLRPVVLQDEWQSQVPSPLRVNSGAPNDVSRRFGCTLNSPPG